MSRPGSSAPSIPRLLERLSTGNERDALQAAKALAQLAAADPSEALRLAQCGGAVPALVQAFRSPNAAVAANATAALIAVGREAPGLVADAASSALVDALRGRNSGLGARAARLLCDIAGRNPARVAAAPGALQALCSAVFSLEIETVDGAALALFRCARGSAGLARLVADTPGSLAGLAAAVASSNSPNAADCAVGTMHEIAKASADLAARVISTPGAPQELSQMALHCGDVAMAERAAAVLVEAAKAGPEPAHRIAAPDVLAALVSASGRAGMAAVCMAAFCNLAGASPPLALRVADTPGAEAAMLAALTCSELVAASMAANTLRNISAADAQRISRLLSRPDVPAALARLLQSNDAAAVTPSTVLLALMEEYGAQMVARLPPLPGTVLQAWTAMLGGAEAIPASAAGLVLHGLGRAGADEARRVMSTPGFTKAVASALGHSDACVVMNALAALTAVAAAGPDLAARAAGSAGVFPALIRALQSRETTVAANAAGLLSHVCASDAWSARRAVAAPGVLRALVALLQHGPGDNAALNASRAVAGMAAGLDGLRPDLAARLAAKDGLLLTLAASAQRFSGLQASQAVLGLANIVACTPQGGSDLASLVGRTEGAIPALVRALREGDDDRLALLVMLALTTIAAAGPQDLGQRILDAGTAHAAVAVVALAHGGCADALLASQLKASAAALLQTLTPLDADAVTATLASLLAPGGTAASAFARGLLAAAPLWLGPVAIEALARQADATAEARARAAALQALAAASAAEAAATRPRLCTACGRLQCDAAGGVRLRPCSGCSGKGPAGRVLYCGAGCQRAHWPVHKAYCKQGLVPGGTA